MPSLRLKIKEALYGFLKGFCRLNLDLYRLCKVDEVYYFCKLFTGLDSKKCCIV